MYKWFTGFLPVLKEPIFKIFLNITKEKDDTIVYTHVINFNGKTVYKKDYIIRFNFEDSKQNSKDLNLVTCVEYSIKPFINLLKCQIIDGI